MDRDPSHIMQVGMGFWASKTVLSAVELELFTQLGSESLTGEEVAGRIGLHPRATYDFLDTLVALNFLERHGDGPDGRYANTPDTAVFLDRNSPAYIGGILEMANARLYRFWGDLTEALQTGEPQNEVKHGGQNLFEMLYSDPAGLASFLGAMTGMSHGANMAIAAKFPWEKYKTFVDAGTAQGDLAVQVALKHPHLRGIGLDLPVVKPIFEAYAQKTGVASRLTFVEGNFFTDPLPTVDVVMMGHILHDWDLSQKRLLVRKAYEAVPPGGAFIVYESIIDDDRRRNVVGLLMSLNMLIETPGGFDYTGADCIGWMKEVGFKEAYVEHLVGPDSMVVGIK